MRRSWGIAAAAVLAAGTLGIQTTSATSATGGEDRASDQGADAIEALRAHPQASRLSPGAAFEIDRTITDANGATHVRMNRTYRGLDVLGGDLVVHQGASDGWRGVSQTLSSAVELSTDPAVRSDAAQAAAVRPAEDTENISNLRAQGAPRLVVDAVVGAPRLAWEVRTVGRMKDGTPSGLATYVDATSGAVIRREESIMTTDGSGTSLYSGTVPIQVTQSGTTYLLKETAARGNAATSDMKNKQGGNATVFSGSDTLFGGTAANRETAGVDAHYGGATTFDYFKLVHGRNGIFGNGIGANSRVHYGRNYVNAFWDGSKMTYGDGDGVEFGPLVSLDVAGHEMTHGVTESVANLTYSGESGGLNEATSDIFGTMVEFYAANPNDPADYLIGEEFDKLSGLGFRRMDDPIQDGSSPSCYSANTKNLGVHSSSGVGNHFFYLLAEGSGTKTIGGTVHNSPTCNGSTVTGIGRDAAQKIWFRALDVYMTSGTTYAQARAATLNSAADLFGAGSANHNAVAAAWSAVSVN